jgi:tripartite-type tricarboxylate transporter receptor subunit TctC
MIIKSSILNLLRYFSSPCAYPNTRSGYWPSNYYQIGTILQGLSLIKADRLRPLAVSGNKRQPVLPDVPTASEVGLKGYDADNWWGILAPAGTPPEVIQKLSTTIADILSKPETIKKLADESATVAYLGPDEFGKFMESESQKWAQLIKNLKIQPE